MNLFKLHFFSLLGTRDPVSIVDINLSGTVSQAETTMPSLFCSFRAAGVRLIREMCQEDLHAVVKSCFALVNSSVSEGMSAAILEVGSAQMLRMGYWIILLSLLCFLKKKICK